MRNCSLADKAYYTQEVNYDDIKVGDLVTWGLGIIAMEVTKKFDTHVVVDGDQVYLEDGEVAGGATYNVFKSEEIMLVYPVKSDGKGESPEDVVSQPSHYTRWPIQPLAFIERNGFEFWRGNIVKYVSRAGFKLYPGKDEVESEIIDLEKVKRYADARINILRGEVEL